MSCADIPADGCLFLEGGDDEGECCEIGFEFGCYCWMGLRDG
jgi:hypothetical protein